MEHLVKARDLKKGNEVVIWYRDKWGWCKIIDIMYIPRKHKYILTIEEVQKQKNILTRHYINSKRIRLWYNNEEINHFI